MPIDHKIIKWFVSHLSQYTRDKIYPIFILTYTADGMYSSSVSTIYDMPSICRDHLINNISHTTLVIAIKISNNYDIVTVAE